MFHSFTLWWGTYASIPVLPCVGGDEWWQLMSDRLGITQHIPFKVLQVIPADQQTWFSQSTHMVYTWPHLDASKDLRSLHFYCIIIWGKIILECMSNNDNIFNITNWKQFNLHTSFQQFLWLAATFLSSFSPASLQTPTGFWNRCPQTYYKRITKALIPTIQVQSKPDLTCI